MKARGQMAVGDGFDGFDKNVAEKMPKIRKEGDPLPSALEAEPKAVKEDLQERESETGLAEKQSERKAIFEPRPMEAEREENLHVAKLIEDLHSQLLVSNRTKRALEMDLTFSQKTIQQLIQENKDLEGQLEGLKKERQRLREIESESTYLEEENADALERIRELQEELKEVKETLARTIVERDEVLSRIQNLESQIEQNDFFKIKERLKEREVSHFSEENRELRSRLEEALAQNIDLENRYGALRRSFNEVKESLTLLRDSCKANYYNLPETAE